MTKGLDLGRAKCDISTSETVCVADDWPIKKLETPRSAVALWTRVTCDCRPDGALACATFSRKYRWLKFMARAICSATTSLHQDVFGSLNPGYRSSRGSLSTGSSRQGEYKTLGINEASAPRLSRVISIEVLSWFVACVLRMTNARRGILVFRSDALTSAPYDAHARTA